MKLLRVLGATALLSGVVVSTFGCEEIEPGDYVFYRVAVSSQDLSSGCYDPTTAYNIEYDKSNLRDRGTFILFAGLEQTFYLDTGGQTLTGAEDGDGYLFNGETVDVQLAAGTDFNAGPRITTKSTYKVTIAVDGSAITGTSETKTTVTCDGAGNVCADFQVPACTVKTDFVGIEVDDVDLEHDVPEAGSVIAAPTVGVQPPPPPRTCDSCNEALIETAIPELCTAEIDPDYESLTLWVNMMTCGCSDAECGPLCVDTCGAGAPLSFECRDCLGSVCALQYFECDSDIILDAEPPVDPPEE